MAGLPTRETAIFGNVNYSLHLEEIKSVAGSNMYYLDQIIAHSMVFTRIVLTLRNINNVRSVAVNMPFFPLVEVKGETYIACTCIYEGRRLKHCIEVAVECPPFLDRILHSISVVEITDHNVVTSARECGGELNCEKHPVNESCPYPSTLETTRNCIEEQSTSLLEGISTNRGGEDVDTNLPELNDDTKTDET